VTQRTASLMPAKAGIPGAETPAFAGMTNTAAASHFPNAASRRAASARTLAQNRLMSNT
jgi:hypothetical protein